MKLRNRIFTVLLTLALLVSSLCFSTSAARIYDPNKGAFVFNNEAMLDYLADPRRLDVAFDTTERTVKLTVTGDDPYLSLDFSKLTSSLNSAYYPYLVMTYRVPNDVSSDAATAELFLSCGSITGPTGGYSYRFDVTRSSKYVSKIIKVSDLSFWTGKVNGIRIDPFSNSSVGDVMYLDSIVLCSNELSANNVVRDRSLNTYNPAGNVYAGSDYLCTEYDVSKYTSPIWKGNLVYNEAVYPVMDENGNATYTLMYEPDEVLTLFNSDFTAVYTEGIDFVVSGDKLMILKTGNISLSDYNATPDAAKGYLNITYTHSDTWGGPVPENKSSLLPLTADKITNKGAINIVYFGDSVVSGATSSATLGTYPNAASWTKQITSKLKNDYGLTVTETVSNVNNSTSEALVNQVAAKVVAPNPDLVFIACGSTDAINASGASADEATFKSEYKSNVEEMITAIRQSLPNCEIVLVSPAYGNPLSYSANYFDACRDALSELEAEYSGVALADVTSMHSYLLTFKNYLDTTGDNMYCPNDFMSRIYSQISLETIVPDGVDAYIPEGQLPDIEKPVIEPPYYQTKAEPNGHGWYWTPEEAYGYISNYGGSTQDVDITFDLSLLPVAGEESVAMLQSTNEANVYISKYGVEYKGTTYGYDWGDVSAENWHRVNIIMKNWNLWVYIDGELVVDNAGGILFHNDYQLLWSITGSMMIDNYKMTDSNGKVFFDLDFEDQAEAERLCSDSLGSCIDLNAHTVYFDLNGAVDTYPNQVKLENTHMYIPLAEPVREGYQFLGWASSADADKAEFKAGSFLENDSISTLYAVWADENAPVEERTLGDLNGDGSVNSIDINLIRRQLTGSYTLTGLDFTAADIDGNGSIGTIDLNLLTRIILGSYKA